VPHAEGLCGLLLHLSVGIFGAHEVHNAGLFSVYWAFLELQLVSRAGRISGNTTRPNACSPHP
jgi:hypothetical protein